VRFAKGAELGRFNLGSTVVALFPRGVLHWSDGLETGAQLLMGTEIARLAAAS
jgi:phosphatidylserine decarboxylase